VVVVVGRRPRAPQIKQGLKWGFSGHLKRCGKVKCYFFKEKG